MKWVIDNRGNVFIALVVVLTGVISGLLIYGMQFPAEAVIGGVGNLSTASNPHNLSNDPGGIRASNESQICIFCHTPHNAIMNDTLINAPLWNHKLSTMTYAVKTPGTLYSNGTMVMNVTLLTQPPNQPDGTSRLCLSCHDGTVGIGDVQSVSTPIGMATNSCIDGSGKLISGSGCNAYIGNDLTGKHVVSVPMNQALIDASLANCGTGGQTFKVQYPWDGSTAQTDIVLLRPTRTTYAGSAGVTRSSGKYRDGYNYGVQCSTCHDPHFWTAGSNYNVPGTKFLVTDFNSLCSACHISC